MGTVGSFLTKLMAYFEDKIISKTSALLLYAQLEHDTYNKHIMQEQQDLLQVFVYYYFFFFQAAPGFLSGRVVDSWPRAEPSMEILEWRAIFFQRPLPGLVGISNSNLKKNKKKLTKLLCSQSVSL